MSKLIAIDMDGTLLSPKGVVTPRTKSAVHRVLDAGLKVCFATGRNLTESRPVLDAVDHHGISVFVGGAIVIDPRQNRLLHRSIMNPDLARELSAFFESHGHAALAIQDTDAAGADYFISSHIETNLATQTWMAVCKAVVQFRDDLARHSHEHTMRVSMVVPDHAATSIVHDLHKTFGERIVSHSIVVPGFGVRIIETFDPAVNKWQGVMRVADHYGIDRAHTIAIGDDVNDISMVRSAGLGIAMGNANPELRAVARQIIGPNSEDGLAVFLEELVRN